MNQLVDIYNTFCQAIGEGKEVRAVFCDISKAFDMVWYRGLIAKLKHYGINGPLLVVFESYLSDRHQKVVLPNGNSDSREKQSWSTSRVYVRSTIVYHLY